MPTGGGLAVAESGLSRCWGGLGGAEPAHKQERGRREAYPLATVARSLPLDDDVVEHHAVWQTRHTLANPCVRVRYSHRSEISEPYPYLRHPWLGLRGSVRFGYLTLFGMTTTMTSRNISQKPMTTTTTTNDWSLVMSGHLQLSVVINIIMFVFISKCVL